MQFDFQLLEQFKKIVWDYYRQHGRPFAWRHADDPYLIVVSEIMLQQTQTYRVEPKFDNFIIHFPTLQNLAQAELREVLLHWQGLGYNRRGKFLHELAKQVVTKYSGIIPSEPALLEELPGIGPATARSICAFAFNKPTVFIETNIRTVFIHSFFPGQQKVHDKQLLPLIEATVDADHARDWYYALMDYGVFLKKQLPNPSRKSAHHAKQSKFQGSDRQIRGAIVRALTKYAQLPQSELNILLQNELNAQVERTEPILAQMIQEGLVKKNNGSISI